MKQLSDDRVVSLSRSIAGRFRGTFPPGVTLSDAVNDAAVLILRLQGEYADRCHDKSYSLESWVSLRAWGDLRDQYARLYREAAAIGHSQAPEWSQPESDTIDPVDAVVDSDVALDVRAALDSLDPVEKRAMVMHLAGETQVSIGAALGITQSYVSQTLTRARQKLAARLAAYRTED